MAFLALGQEPRPTFSRAMNEIGNVVKEKVVMLLRRLVLFARNSGRKFGKIAKEKFVTLLDRFVLFAQSGGRDRENDNNESDKGKPLFQRIGQGSRACELDLLNVVRHP